MPCNLCGKWNCVCQYSQSKQQQEFTSGFFSREAMKEHSDFHPQPKAEQGEPATLEEIRKAMIFGIPLYTTPQQRKPLTNEQIDEIADTVANMPLVGIVHDFRTRFARAIEEAHDIKE